jgi:hypothetical protein
MFELVIDLESQQWPAWIQLAITLLGAPLLPNDASAPDLARKVKRSTQLLSSKLRGGKRI